MQRLMQQKWHLPVVVVATLAIVAVSVPAIASARKKPGPLAGVKHLVVLYLENHSFDNLYGSFPGANGLTHADPAHTLQVDLTGSPYKCLPQTDPHLTSPPLPADACSVAAGDPFDSHFPNKPFELNDFIPDPSMTIDLSNRYYQHQVMIDGGKLDKFVSANEAKGLAVGYYDTASLPLAREARRYALADNFFMAAYGGSFLNHQWLICACTPVFPNAPRDGGPNDQHSVLDANGLPVKDGALTTVAQGDFAVNTIQPAAAPFKAGTPDAKRLPPQSHLTIGDELTAKGVSWAWYSGGWNDAVAGSPDPLFQYHHQPFNFYASYAPGTPGRSHLKDETDFVAAARNGTLPAVSFVKPNGPDNEHPGYANLARGEQHALELIDAVRRGPNWKDTAIVVTYDENGGSWDHVPPPSGDRWGPGSRVPLLIVSPLAKRHYVGHERYDTTSILATIEHRFGLAALGTRDAAARDLRGLFEPSR